MKKTHFVLGAICAAAFVATVWAANYALNRWGAVSVGFGYSAPAGVFFAGVAFTLRDVTHRTLGRAVVIGAVLAGALLSYLISDGTIPGGHVSIAVASGLAFLLSEMFDLAVYEPVRKHGWLPAVALSNTVGLVVDSAVFLWLAFGSLSFFWGQVIGKAWMTVAAIALLAGIQTLRSRLYVEAIA